MPIFVPGDLDLSPLTLTFKLVRARDQTRLQCEFGANSFSGSQRYFIHKQKSHRAKSHRQHQKQNLMQFTVCSKSYERAINYASHSTQSCKPCFI